MKSYDRAQVTHLIGAALLGLTMWAVYVGLRMGPGVGRDPTAAFFSTIHALSLFCQVVGGLGLAAILPIRRWKFVLDHRPFLGALILATVHAYIQILICIIFVHLKVVILDPSAKRLEFLDFFRILLLPIGLQVWFFPITLTAIIIATVVWGFTFRKLQMHNSHS